MPDNPNQYQSSSWHHYFFFVKSTNIASQSHGHSLINRTFYGDQEYIYLLYGVSDEYCEVW